MKLILIAQPARASAEQYQLEFFSAFFDDKDLLAAHFSPQEIYILRTCGVPWPPLLMARFAAFVGFSN